MIARLLGTSVLSAGW